MCTENEKRLRRCCFTGHRPGKLHASEKQIKSALRSAVEGAYADGYRTFITGMAQGVDIWAGELVLEFKCSHPDIRIICALPHPDFEKKWSKEWQHRYNAILSQADLIKTVCDTFLRHSTCRRTPSGNPSFAWLSLSVLNILSYPHTKRRCLKTFCF